MQKTIILLAIFVGFVITGVALTFYVLMLAEKSQIRGWSVEIGDGSSENNTELDVMLNKLKGIIVTKNATALEISMELDPLLNGEAEYSVRAAQFKEGTISARIVDPFGNHLVSKIIDTESVREKFQVSSPGTHTLVIENYGTKSEVGGSMIHTAPIYTRFLIGEAGLYLQILGFIGAVTVGTVALLRRYMRSSVD